MLCKSIGCINEAAKGLEVCTSCQRSFEKFLKIDKECPPETDTPQAINIKELDVFAVHQLFDLYDPSGAIHEASRLLLTSSQRNDNKTLYEVALEARQVLDRFIQLQEMGL